MRNIGISLFAFAALAASAAGPRFISGDGISMTQDPATRRVTVTYSLSEEPGIVTFAVQTNAGDSVWVPIGGEAVSCVYGDVNRIVTNTTTPSSFVWIPDDTWPDRVIADGTLRCVVSVWPTNDPPDYIVVDRIPGGISYYANAESIPGGVTNEVYRHGKFLLRRIHATGARFTMGSPIDEPGRGVVETTIKETPHRVTLTNDYYMGVFEVTQDQWRMVTTFWNAYFYFTNLPYSAELPLTGVDYDEIRGAVTSDGDKWSPDNPLSVAHKVKSTSFMGCLRSLTNIDFDLPTEAEWEFACRAGTSGNFYNSGLRALEDLDKIAWYAGNSSSADRNLVDSPASYLGNGAGCIPHIPGQKEPNAFGLYDMIGNGSELCLDWYASDYGGTANKYEPEGPATGSARSFRSNTAPYDYPGQRAARRANTSGTYYGTRLVCPITLKYSEGEK